MKTHTKKDFVVMPWKNGQGTTTELYRLSDPKNPESFLFRLSMAKVVSPGTFSFFPNIDRVLLLLEGDGLILKFSHRSTELTDSNTIVAFSGEEKIDCELVGGPILDFNVMVDRSFGEARVRRARAKEKVIRGGRHIIFIYDHRRSLLSILDEHEVFLLRGDEIIVDLELRASGG